MASKIGKMMSQANNSLQKSPIPYGRVASSNGKTVNMQNTVSGEARELKTVAPYGISSCPPSGLFAQTAMNGDTNDVCIGVHNPNAPAVTAGEIIIYSSGGASIKLSGATVLVNGTNMSELSQLVQTLQDTVNTLQGTVNTLQGTVNTLQGTVNTLQDTVANHESRISSLEEAKSD